MKKTVFELSFDDETSMYDIRSEFSPLSGLDPQSLEYLNTMNQVIDKLVERLLDKRDLEISRIIKMITMSDICSDVQPYEHIELLWSMMMNDYLPEHEKHFRKMKERRGLRVKVQEPIRFVNMDLFNSGNSKLS